jgi:hypothetical protein
MNKTTKMKLSACVATVIAGMLHSPLSLGSVTLDLNAKMTKMLGHAPEVTSVLEAQSQRLDRSEAKAQPWSGSYWPDINGGIANHYRDHGKLGAELNFMMRYNIAKARLNQDHRQVVKKIDKWDNEKINEKLSPAEKYDLLLGDLNFTFTNAVMDEADFRSKYRLTTKRAESGDDQESEGDDNTSSYEDDLNTYSKFDDKIQYRYWRPKNGSLAYWSGICDGWSPASIYLPRPAKSVTVIGALGHKITFFPDDLKALGSYLFARTNTPYFATMDYQMAGRKCDPKGTPDQDERGVVKDIRCNDLDPGVWHMALINRIGKDRMGFVMDLDNNIKINNHPVASYSVNYYNPATGEDGNLKKSIVDISKVKDAYKFRRNAKAKYLVGVTSTVDFMYYIWPEQNKDETMDSSSKDKIKNKTYIYDLELDENYNILGGEWGSRAKENGSDVKYSEQPDFIWMAAPQNLPYSEMSIYATAGVKKDINNPRPFDNMNWAWDGKSALPGDWISAAKADMSWQAPIPGEKIEAADGSVDVAPMEAKNGVLKSAQPLSHIVYFLFDKARNSTQK